MRRGAGKGHFLELRPSHFNVILALRVEGTSFKGVYLELHHLWLLVFTSKLLLVEKYLRSKTGTKVLGKEDWCNSTWEGRQEARERSWQVQRAVNHRQN